MDITQVIAFFILLVVLITFGIMMKPDTVSQFVNYVWGGYGPRWGWRRWGWRRRPYWGWAPWRPRPIRQVIVYEGMEDGKDAEDVMSKDATFSPDLRKPYSLLNDFLDPVAYPAGIRCTNAEECYKNDFNRAIVSVGNFRQFTNNYKHDYPDSCTTGLPEANLAIYKERPFSIERKGLGCLD